MGRFSEEQATKLLIDSGAVLASSLDPAMTMMQVAELTIGPLADLCVIDVVAPDGRMVGSTVVGRDPEVAARLQVLRERTSLDVEGGHPVARVLRSGTLLRIRELTPAHVDLVAQSEEHARFVAEQEYRSVIVAPLQVPGRTLGALTVLRVKSSEPYEADEEPIVQELARRAAMAIENGRLYGELRGAERRFHAILENLTEAVTLIEESGKLLYANRAAADLLGFESPEALLAAPMGSIWPRFTIYDKHGRELERSELPSWRLMQGEVAEPMVVRRVLKSTGQERWVRVHGATFIDEEQGGVRLLVNAYEDVPAPEGV